MKKLINCTTLATLVLMSVSCEDEPKGSLAFESLHDDAGLITSQDATKLSKTLMSENDYITELANYSTDTAKDIDFTQSTVVLVDMGYRNNGRYSINVEEVIEYEDYVTVEVSLTLADSSCITTQATIHPYEFVEIPTTKEVLIQEVYNIKDC